MKEKAGRFKKLLKEGKFSRRDIFKSAILGSLISVFGENVLGIGISSLNTILGRPTKSTMAISLLSNSKSSTYIEYGYAAANFLFKSEEVILESLTPSVIELKNLKPNSRVYYRIRNKLNGSSTFTLGEVNFFNTARIVGSNFSFAVLGDSHPERAGKMFNAELYNQTLSNISKQKPDFMIMLGDDFSIDPLIERGQANKENVENVYATQRNWLTNLAKSIPLFLVNGNHEQAAAYLLDGTEFNPAVLAGNARMKYFPLPDSNGFYSADSEIVEFVGKPRDYYSWNWGDALFITLDPYWHSKNPVDNVAGVSADAAQTGGKGNGKTGDLWSIGIGDVQYEWLKKTLQNSKAKYKFVFSHHVMGTGRGGVEISTNYEWGGQDPKGKKTFAEMRPNWELPIHDLMVKNGVSIFFQGHDHIFVHQERDGLIYQSMPNPADDTFTMFNEASYKSGTKAPNSGHVKVIVGPKVATVEYFLSARKQDVSTDRQNLKVAHSYTVKAKI
jgi:Calcineurin-like phosphoesterase